MNVRTPHGIGTFEHYEVFEPLNHLNRGRASIDYLPQLPELAEGSFYRVGVRGAHPTLDVAYYMPEEVAFL